MSPDHFIAIVDAFSDPEDEHELDRLNNAVIALRDGGHAQSAVRPLLGVFERFPTHDGYGVFWTILHTLEGVPGSYETELVQSIRRAPSEFGLRMITRTLNGGREAIDGVLLVGVLHEVATSSTACAAVRETAAAYAQMNETV